MQDFTINPDNSIEENIQNYIIQFLSQELVIAKDQIKINKNIRDYGVDSIMVKKLTREFEKRFQIRITGREILEFSTIKSLSAYLASKKEELNNERMDVNAKLTRESHQKSKHTDDLLAESLEEFKYGALTLEEIENLIDKGEII
jgi:acyl carrier protein